MVSASGIDLVGPVDLLQKHHPQQVVGKGHGGHGQPQIGLLFQRGVHPVGTADEEDDVSGAPGGDAISAVDVDWSERKSLTVDQQAQAALEQLLGACTEPGYRTPIPQGVTLRSCQLTGGMALVDFSQGYEQLSGIDLTIADYSKLVIADIIKTVGKPSALGSKEVKLRILRKLEEKGVFQLKDSVPQVCELLDISQATLYNYLREIRTQGSGFLPLSQK